MRICLFEDPGALAFEPLAATRPVFELRCGATDLRTKQLRHFGADSHAVLVRPVLAELYRRRHLAAAVNDINWLRSGDTLFVNGRWLPGAGACPRLDDYHVATLGDDIAYAYVPAGLLSACCPDTIRDCLRRWEAALPHRPAGGKMLRYPWDLVENNPQQIEVDFARLEIVRAERLPSGVVVEGPRERVAIAADSRIEAFVLLDATHGPVIVDAGAFVAAFSRLEGPCYVGPRTQVMGAKIRAGTTLGPECRIGGEVEASIVHGYSNKYHEGFLGHSYVGEWVNLGAGTHNSDLRNDYGEVAVPNGQSKINTGLCKVGCFIGDHAKTGLGTLINTGSHIGAFANLLPAGMLAPKYVPPFTILWKGTLQEVEDLDRVLATAEKVMKRRGQELTEAHAALYRQLFEETAFIRRRAIQDLERRKVFRSA